MDASPWSQEIVVKPVDGIVLNPCAKPSSALERKARPQKDQALNCPRCSSTNTKFCYYNNYSLTQPRYFCKTCRRYWTEGGSLRNIPVGGGSRKNKRSTTCSTSSSSSSSSKKLHDLNATACLSLQSPPPHNPSEVNPGQDLNLTFNASPGIKSFTQLIQVPSSTSAANNASPFPSLELLTGVPTGGISNSLLSLPIQDPNTAPFSSGFTLQDFKPTLNFSLDLLGGNYAPSMPELQESGTGGVFFPFGDMKQVSAGRIDHCDEQNRENGNSTGYWTGMLGGSSW